LNAQIEAVRAGETGARFRTVAEEVRRLAQKTLEATRIIRANVSDIGSSVNEIGALGAEERVVVDHGIESVRALVKYFENAIDQAVRTREAVSTITLVTQQQASASGQMVDAVREVEQVAHQSEEGSKTIEALILDLTGMAGRLEDLVTKPDHQVEPDPPLPD
jgi:methyl-accepting chemotaxis protein